MLHDVVLQYISQGGARVHIERPLDPGRVVLKLAGPSAACRRRAVGRAARMPAFRSTSAFPSIRSRAGSRRIAPLYRWIDLDVAPAF